MNVRTVSSKVVGSGLLGSSEGLRGPPSQTSKTGEESLFHKGKGQRTKPQRRWLLELHLEKMLKQRLCERISLKDKRG